MPPFPRLEHPGGWVTAPSPCPFKSRADDSFPLFSLLGSSPSRVDPLLLGHTTVYVPSSIQLVLRVDNPFPVAALTHTPS